MGVKWSLGAECGDMWRVLHQYMDTMNGPADFLEEPVNPITGTKFENASSTKMVHIAEFTADLIKHGKPVITSSTVRKRTGTAGVRKTRIWRTNFARSKEATCCPHRIKWRTSAAK